MMQVEYPPASPIIRVLFSVVELQRQLYVPRGLGTCNLSHRGCGASEAHVRCIELDVVESVDEVASELQTKPLAELEVLMQTQVHVGVMRRAQRSELRCAIAESAKCRGGEVSIVGEPLNAYSREPLVCNRRDGVAV